MELEQFKISAVINVDGLNKKGDWENYDKRDRKSVVRERVSVLV